MDELKKLLEAGKIDENEYNTLKKEFETLISQRDAARNESAQRRVKLNDLKAEAERLKAVVGDLGDKFGIDLEEDNAIDALKQKLGDLGNAKDLDKLKEYEAKLNRLEKERQELEKRLESETKSKIQIMKQKELGAKLSKYDVLDRDIVASYLDSRIVVEDEGLKFKTRDGLLVDLDEGLEEFFKEEKPNVIKGYGSSGSGIQGGGVSAALKTSSNADDILKAAGIKK